MNNDEKINNTIKDIAENYNLEEQINNSKRIIDLTASMEDPQKGIEAVSVVFAETTIKKIAEICSKMGTERFVELCTTVPEFKQISLCLGAYAAVKQATVTKLKKD